MGRKKKTFTKPELNQIEVMAAYGLTQEDIAECFDIDDATLRKHAGKAWRKGKIKAKAQVGGVAYKMAASGNNPSMTKFYLATNCGWSAANHIPPALEKFINLKEKQDELKD